MGMTDTVTKEYMRGNKVFADAFNYLIYGGEQVVKPALLQELDTTEIAIPFALDEEENTTEEAVQKYRDVLKSTVIMQDAKASYILLGVENQTDVHYAMPVRNIIYDALQYGKQVSEVAKKHKNQSDGKQQSIAPMVRKDTAGESTCLGSIRMIKSHRSLHWYCTSAQTSGMVRYRSTR